MSDSRHPYSFSAADLTTLGFLNTPELMKLVQNAAPVAEIELDRVDALLVAGGQAPMFSFADATELQRTFVEFFEAGKVTAAVCHGTAILRYATLSTGEPLVKGRTVTGFANVEEDFADDALWEAGLLPTGTRLMPWRIEDELKKLGANYIQAGLWRGFAT